MSARARLLSSTFLATALLPSAAFAHTASGALGGFATGFVHPISGVDHVLAMLAVGMWGAQLGAPALWALPVAFPLVMAVGGVAGILGLPLPSVEWGIALSVVVLGSMIALERRPGLALAGLLVAFFAVFHGYAHGIELPGRTGALAYSAGFVVATGTIHLVGIALGLVTRLPNGVQALRAGGSAIAAAGVYLAWRLLGA
jgi:urease accessory protein